MNTPALLPAGARRRRTLAGDDRATVAVEFALTLPALLLMLFGVYVVCEALSIHRKLVITAHSLADLIAQWPNSSTDDESTCSTSIASDLTSFLNATAQISAPYASSAMKIVVSELFTDANGATTVVWSKTLNGTALTAGATVTPPSGVIQAKTYVISAAVAYSFSPIVAYTFDSTIPISSEYFINLRNCTSITY